MTERRAAAFKPEDAPNCRLLSLPRARNILVPACCATLGHRGPANDFHDRIPSLGGAGCTRTPTPTCTRVGHQVLAGCRAPPAPPAPPGPGTDRLPACSRSSPARKGRRQGAMSPGYSMGSARVRIHLKMRFLFPMPPGHGLQRDHGVGSACHPP